jgi:hypothetical protein
MIVKTLSCQKLFVKGYKDVSSVHKLQIVAITKIFVLKIEFFVVRLSVAFY